MQENRILLWDLPTRAFHWLLFVLVVAAILTALQGGNLMRWHGLIGQTIIGLIAFRLAWGLFGSTYAQFRNFVRGPSTILSYTRGQWHGVGHNPLGALSVLVLIGMLLFQAVLGLFAYDDIAFRGPFNTLISRETSALLTSVHRQGLWWIVGLVGLHVAAVLYYTIVRRDNLVRPMVTGYKVVADPQAKSATGGGKWPFLIAAFFGVVVAWMAAGGPMTVLAPPPAPVIAPW